jgi:hypothetical protein
LSKPIDRGTWLALAAMGVAVFVLANDFSAINVAIPQIEKDFKTDVSSATWRPCGRLPMCACLTGFPNLHSTRSWLAEPCGDPSPLGFKEMATRFQRGSVAIAKFCAFPVSPTAHTT